MNPQGNVDELAEEEWILASWYVYEWQIRD